MTIRLYCKQVLIVTHADKSGDKLHVKIKWIYTAQKKTADQVKVKVLI